MRDSRPPIRIVALMRTGALTRRDWLKTLAAAGVATTFLPARAATTRATRDFHVCLAPDLVVRDAELVEIVRSAGVGTVWLAGYFYGYKPYPMDLLARARRRLADAGLESELITIPLGHPGNSLGTKDGEFPLAPPLHWRTAVRPDGEAYAGTSLHEPATRENCAALAELRGLGYRTGFVDDDFRLARSPGEIGGCFCADHRDRFLRAGGFAPARWAELLDDIRARRLTPLLRSWLEFNGAELTASFRAQTEAFGGDFGIMVMYLGAEKAGIRLDDYRAAPFRVGELMFDDVSIAPVKGKTDELFSVLFHRRFAAPERAFSETTAFPADKLSAAHMAAKLVISTLADVRHTMFMSGMLPFPRPHWAVLGPAMREQARLHAGLAGHAPRGPFKHCWGEAQRLVGDDQPFSLWLAAGVPFEVVSAPAADGWNFLTDFDARELAAGASSPSARLVCRTSAAQRPAGAEAVGENLDELFAFKRRIRDQLRGVPHIVEDQPAVCAWYPSAGKVLVWNLSDQPKTLTLADGARRTELRLGALGAVVAGATQSPD